MRLAEQWLGDKWKIWDNCNFSKVLLYINDKVCLVCLHGAEEQGIHVGIHKAILEPPLVNARIEQDPEKGSNEDKNTLAKQVEPSGCLKLSPYPIALH